MIVAITDMLTAAELAEIRDGLGRAGWVDGKATAGWHAKLVKDNEQLDPADPVTVSLKAIVTAALKRSALFQAATLPAEVSLIFNRYAEGRSYGAHVDNAYMGGLRTDVSFTLFLSDPESYGGGDLVIDASGIEQRVKLPAGAAIVYPATTLHRVEAVTSGARIACAGWVESRVRDAAAREILFDLDRVKRALFDATGKSEAFDLASKTAANLLRRWGG